MSALDLVLAAAKSKVGTIEKGGKDGKSGNIVWAWDWWKAATGQSDQGSPWCDVSASWSFAQGGATELIAPKGTHGFIYCPAHVAWFKAKKAFLPAKKAHPGDLVFFDFSDHGIAEHVGIVVSNEGKYLVTIEGNTSPEHSTGSQANGGGQYERHRALSPFILGVGRPNWKSLEGKKK